MKRLAFFFLLISVRQLLIANPELEINAGVCPATAAQLVRPIFFVKPIPFSDDLLPDVLGRKPDLSWAYRDKKRLSPKEVAAEYGKQLRDAPGPLAVQLKSLLAGRRFIDLGCGPVDVAATPRIVAEALGASEYIGVDIKVRNQTRRDEFGNGGTFTSTFIKRDLSAYLADEKKVGNNVFYLSGIEALPGQEFLAARYASSVKEKLRRLTVPGDAVLVGTGTSDFDIIPGFRRVRVPGQQRLYVREAD